MKKTFVFLALVMTVLVFASCGSNSPKDVAGKAVECIQKKNFDGYADLVNFSSKEGGDIDGQKKMLVGMLQDKYAKTIEKKGGIKSYEVLSEEIASDGMTAVVGIRITYGDGEEKEDTVKMMKDEGGNWKIDAGK